MTVEDVWKQAIDRMEAERNAAITRAEAAEVELQSALAVIDLYQARMFAAEDELAALRAQVDAQGWQGWPDVPQGNVTVEIQAHGWYDAGNEKWHVYLGDDLVAMPRIATWRPAPPKE